MRKVLVMYKHPEDPEAFRKYYEETHAPLDAKLPNLLASRYSFDVQGLGMESPYFCIWEGEFADELSMFEAGLSPEFQAVTADLPNYATGGVVVVHYEA